ncbi:MAG: hypothetical protein FJW35_17080, partial [Acidobacteria bacterium]|nr:hypothetical protein [Acidobacteriota bacterium]
MLTLALLGFGNVAKAFARHLLGQRDPIPCLIRAVADVSGGTFLDTPGQLPRLLETPAGLLKDSVPAEGLLPVPSFLSSLPAAGIAVLVECLPTNITDGQPALDYLEA